MDFLIINLLNGVAFGAILFLLASGLSLALGVMGILNLAHGALYMVGGFIGWTIGIKCGLNFWLAVLSGAIAGGLLGLVMERGFFRYLRGRLNDQVLLTFGLLYILRNTSLWVWGAVPKASFTAPFLSGSFPIMGYTYPYSRIGTIVIGIILATSLWWLMEKTRAGAVVRAGIDNKEMSMGMGVNVGAVSSSVFVLAAFIAGGSGVIGANLFGVSLKLSMDILLYALIVVVVGGMGSITGALLGGMIIGIVDSFVKGISPDIGYFSLYFIMIIILLVKPTGLMGRKQSQTDQSDGETMSMRPAYLKYAGQSTWGQVIRFSPYIAGGIIFIILPLILPTYFHSLLTKILIFGLFAMSLDLIMGYTGLSSLGHAAFFGISAYTVSVLLEIHGIESFWVTTLAGILAATLAAAILGIIALRVSDIYFVLVTLALGMLVYSMAVKWYWLTRGNNGIPITSYPDLGFSWFTWNATSYYYFVFVFFVICFFLLYRLVHSPFGQALQGIRENEPRMQSMGYNTWLYKYIAFILAGFFAGAAGVLFPYYSTVMNAQNVSVNVSALVILICIIGGVGTLWGPVIGSAVVILVEYFSSIYFPGRWPLVLGGVFVISVMFLRGGIAPKLQMLWSRVSYGNAKS